MKKLLVIAITISLLATILLTSCSAVAEGGGTEGTINSYQGMYMQVATHSVTTTGLRLTMVNTNSSIIFGHGFGYTIERYVNGIWERVPLINDHIVASLLLSVPPNRTIDEDINWEHIHGELPPGKYRIVRNFMIGLWNWETPEEERLEVDLYATFIIGADWESSLSTWQAEQAELAAAAFARYDGLDLEVFAYSPQGLTFRLTNNNPNYSYIIESIFVGWEDNFPDGGHAGAVEYTIFSNWLHETFPAWPFGREVILRYGDYILHQVDWYAEIGNLTPRMHRHGQNPYIFDVVVAVRLDVSDQYIAENFRHTIPGLPNETHRIRGDFDLGGVS
ncbi:MAG: hypothetical protein FWB93_05680 [Oscillospiraceae bacterium]|nr:hypothetical protein [Oscillospiraceae bacterium]